MNQALKQVPGQVVLQLPEQAVLQLPGQVVLQILGTIQGLGERQELSGKDPAAFLRTLTNFTTTMGSTG